MGGLKARKYRVDTEAHCSECGSSFAAGDEGKDVTVDAMAKRHALETGHIVTILEAHDVAAFEE